MQMATIVILLFRDLTLVGQLLPHAAAILITSMRYTQKNYSLVSSEPKLVVQLLPHAVVILITQT